MNAIIIFIIAGIKILIDKSIIPYCHQGSAYYYKNGNVVYKIER